MPVRRSIDQIIGRELQDEERKRERSELQYAFSCRRQKKKDRSILRRRRRRRRCRRQSNYKARAHIARLRMGSRLCHNSSCSIYTQCIDSVFTIID